MAKHHKISLILYLGIAIASIILLSTGLSELDFRSGRPLNLLGLLLQRIGSVRAAPPARLDTGDTSIDLLRVIFWIALIFSIIYAIGSSRFRRQVLRTFLTVIFFVLAIDILRERLQFGDLLSNQSAESAAAGQGGAGLPNPPTFITNPPTWFLLIVNLLLVLIFLGALWLLWRLLRPKPDTQALLVQEARAALTDLQAGGDLKNVVLRCYARMCRVLRESRNIERRRAMTPREFERHLAEIGLRDEHIRRLTRLFEGVRYGAKPSGRPEEREAIACLTAIVQNYEETP
jgi:VanZ family protein